MPVGHDTRRSGRLELAAYAAGALLGGLTTAAVLWFASLFAAPLPAAARHAAVVLAVTAALLHDFGIRRLPLPQNARQVPRSVFANGTIRGFFQFGYEMGTGVRTYVPTATPYVVAAMLLCLTPSLVGGLLSGAGFGAGRAMMPAFRRWSGDPWRWDDSLKRRLGLVTYVSAAVAAVAAGTMVA
ncbi:MAG: hypothetical protein M3277_12505 [Actinomycetota bacterium]|nr:hypothetical protein [Actinomycetota bacterium]